ncbi:unnamed protein product [Acanthoscelides obtectus]|uniref:Uncharacterized protein n=1 Tax=Acanthoscelides obtectus TaxID=200917 RepID=A0A9P0LNE9_ACAOB|nr:unnamed protein product [Acanthoscelides obtectus]CAK1678402.1 hypothetical protein AOBTE_LOCUS31872 [Acanthoscelides obtectus]
MLPKVESIFLTSYVTVNAYQEERKDGLLEYYTVMLDGGAVNSYVIYQANSSNTMKTPRRMYLMQLGEELAKEHMKRRLEVTNLSQVLDIAERDIADQVPPIL